MGRPIIGGVTELTAADLVQELRGGASSVSISSSVFLSDSPPSFPREPGDGNVAAAASVLGMDPGRIRSLKGNPAFLELVAFYRDRGDEVILDLKARMELLAHDSLAELHERLIGEPETSLSNGEVINLVESLLDRLGHAPVQKGVVANVTLTGQEMQDLFHGANRVRVLEDVREATEAVPSEPAND
jgi:hypothetical protein